MSNNFPPDPEKEGLEKAGELLKVTLSLATGSLVFGAALAKEQLSFSGSTRLAIIFLAVAAASGILAMSAIPTMIAKKNYDLEDRFLTWPARVHQLSFAVGVVLMGYALATSLPKDSENQRSARDSGSIVKVYMTDPHRDPGCEQCHSEVTTNDQTPQVSPQ